MPWRASYFRSKITHSGRPWENSFQSFRILSQPVPVVMTCTSKYFEERQRSPEPATSAVQVVGSFAIWFCKQRSLLLDLLHGRLLISICLLQKQATAQHIHSCIVNLLPTMETTTLTQSPNSIGESMVKIMEEHLVETVAATQKACHDFREDRVAAVGVQGQELIPPVGVVEVGEECPCNGEASAAGHCHGDEESPALRQRPSQRPSSQKPHASPQGCHKQAVADSVRYPLSPEIFVALATSALIWEIGVPQHGKESASVIGTNPMPNWNQGHSQPSIPLVSPLLQDIEPSCWVPAKLSMHQKVHSAGMVPLVLQNNLLPGQWKLISPAVSDVLLPLIRREGGTVQNVMQNVDVLDHEPSHRHSEERGGKVPIYILREHEAVCQDASTLAAEQSGVHVPHIEHPERRAAPQKHALCLFDTGGPTLNPEGIKLIKLVQLRIRATKDL